MTSVRSCHKVDNKIMCMLLALSDDALTAVLLHTETFALGKLMRTCRQLNTALRSLDILQMLAAAHGFKDLSSAQDDDEYGT